jgi:hypothetical protein
MRLRYKFLYWYQALHPVQQWLVKIGGAIFILLMLLIVTRTPSDRPRQPKIILDCKPGCGVDPERSISYNEYMDRKEREQKAWFYEDKKRIQQEIWDEKGRQRWCRNHPQDRNCKQ